MSRTPSLTAEALARLNSIGTPAKPTSINGWWSISGSSCKTITSGGSKESLVIPEYVESYETLEYLGFTRAAAQKLWDRIRNNPTLEMNPFGRMVRAWVRSFPDAIDDSDDWDAVMTAIGIQARLRWAILTPEYTGIRLSQTAHYWIIDRMDCAFTFLETVSERILAKLPVVESTFSCGALSSKDTDVPSITSVPCGPSSPTNPAAAITFPENPQEHMSVFYKGGDIMYLEKAVKLQDNDNKSLAKILTHGPSDLARLARLYVTEQREVARSYAEYALVRNEGGHGVGVLRVKIPTRFLNDTVDLYGDEWRDFVWCCRRTERIPQQLKYLESTPVIRAPMWMVSNKKALKASTTKMDVVPYKMHGNNTSFQLGFLLGRVEEMEPDCTVQIDPLDSAEMEKALAVGLP